MENDTRCRLLGLPAELRVRIYEYCLAPTGTLCLTATQSKRYATEPTLAPMLLCTCRQIYTEACKILQQQNMVCFSIDVHNTQWPVISENRLPQHVLEKLEHAAIILNAASLFYSSYRHVEWTALSALVSLETLQVSIVSQVQMSSTTREPFIDYQPLLDQFLAHIPSRTVITYGTQEHTAERAILERLVERLQRGRDTGPTAIKIREATPTEYDEMAHYVNKFLANTRGTKNGGVRDVFAEWREDRRTALAGSAQLRHLDSQR